MATQVHTIESIATEIQEELSDTNLSITSIAFTLRSLIGDLNTWLDTNFIVNSSDLSVHESGKSSRTLTEQEKAILIKLYMVRYWTRQIRQNLGAAGVQRLVSIDSDGHSIEYSRPTTVASEYRQLREQERNDLRKLVFDYKRNAMSPLQVVGQDAVDSDGDVSIARDAEDFNRLNSSDSA